MSPQEAKNLVGHTPSPQHKRDVVERLRDHERGFGGRDGMPDVSDAFRTAADEIERLRKLIEAMQAGKT